MSNFQILGVVTPAKPAVPGGKPEHEHGKGNFLTRAAGPLKIWEWSLIGVLVAGAATGAGLYLAKHKKHKR